MGLGSMLREHEGSCPRVSWRLNTGIPSYIVINAVEDLDLGRHRLRWRAISLEFGTASYLFAKSLRTGIIITIRDVMFEQPWDILLF